MNPRRHLFASLGACAVIALGSAACQPAPGSPDSTTATTTAAAPTTAAPAPTTTRAPTTTTQPTTTTTTTTTTAPTTWQIQMLVSLNAQRALAGAAPLSFCGNLTNASAGHSADQAATQTMSHTGSNGSTMVQRAEAAGYLGWNALGENVAYGYNSVDSVMTAWMNSAGHRANIVSTSFTHVGIARASSPSGTLYWTQDFGRGGSC